MALFLARTIYNPRPDEAGPYLPDPADLCDTGRFPSETALRTHLLNAFIPAAFRPHSIHPAPWTSARAEHILRKVARHLERRRHGTVDIAWWELRYALPAPVLAAVIGSVVGLFTLVLSTAGRAAWLLGDYYFPFLGDCGVHCDNPVGKWLRGFGVFPNFLAVVLPIPLADHAYPPEDWWLLFLDWPTGVASASIYIALGFIVGGVARLGSRSVPARRLRWSFNLRTLALGLLCSLTTGVFVGLGYGRLAGLSWATIALSICTITTGLTALSADARTAASPITLLREDQRSFAQILLVPVIAGSLFLGPGIALGHTGTDEYLALSDHLVFLGSGFGFWVGCILGLALALNRTASGRFILIRLYLILFWRMPWNVLAFLDDAHRNRGVLRQVGSVYQFRHVDLQRHLATPDATPPASPAANAPPPSTNPPS
ncbi:hypothetical protein HCK01_26285 [Streptomyces sp. AA8]|uniref:hypothetical protein n=1 Tax=Streptomyces telluris TaxID=2720021 RepID=UPI00143C5AC1|nr:hypothetical protein [Streptomyces telluris]NJP80764.1 hypothetical protein [Streptomyces telluris]